MTSSASARKAESILLLDAKTGEFIWNTLIGPGGDQGGMNWGTAFDGERIYASITNHHHIPYKLTQNGVIWEHDRHRRIVGGARSEDGEDSVADSRSAGRDVPGWALLECGISRRSRLRTVCCTPPRWRSSRIRSRSSRSMRLPARSLWQYPARAVRSTPGRRRQRDVYWGSATRDRASKGAAATALRVQHRR